VSPPLHVFQHHEAEGPGEIALWAHARGLRLKLLQPALGALPGPDVGALVLLGGPHSALQAHAGLGPPWLRDELAWLRSSLDAGSAVFAVCLGAQLLASALGAELQRLPTPEMGWTSIHFKAPTQAALLDMPQWHEDGFALPPGAQTLAHSPAWPQQMFASGARRVGLQFHPEWNANSLRALNAAYGAESPFFGAPIDDQDPRFVASRQWLWQQLDAWWRVAMPGNA
jgi:GMP synthase-like glutamine amidotransferase